MDRPTDTLSTLQHVLASAAGIARDLAGDPLLARLLDVFARTPPEDREAIVGIFEREVDLRNLAIRAPSAPFSGVQVTKPNPNARLYFRVADKDSVPFVSPQEIVQAVMRAARVIHRAAQRGVDLEQVWRAPMVEGLERIAPEERETMRWYHAAILKLLDEAEHDAH